MSVSGLRPKGQKVLFKGSKWFLLKTTCLCHSVQWWSKPQSKTNFVITLTHVSPPSETGFVAVHCVYCMPFNLTFFPPCFSTMSVLSGKWSSWGVLEPPPLGIVQLSPRQASFTLPLHRHQPSGTKRKTKWCVDGGEGEFSTWRFIENTFTHCQTMQPLVVHQALHFQPLHPWLWRKSI